MTYRFGDVEVDPGAFRVTRAGEPVHLEPKAIEVLLFLARNPGRLVTKAEVQEAVWKDTFVTESALTRLVAQVRKGLGDDAREARYIETVPTRGYRFVAVLEPGPEAPVPVAAAAAARWRPGLPLAAAATALLALTLLGLSVWGRTGRGSHAAAGTGPGSRALELQLSTSPTLNVFPSFSPDGASIAFAVQRNGSMEIVVRALALGAREVPVTGDGMQNVQPAFSPDGRRLAYHSIAHGGIRVVPALGGIPRQLTSFGSFPAWSPDGLQIAFQSQAWAGAGETLSAASEGSTIWLVSAEGGEPRRLTTIADVGPGGQGAPAWSPDGRLVSFLAGTRVLTVGADGRGLRETSGNLRVHGLAWEKNGRSQVWTGFQAGNWAVWRIPVDPATGERAGEPEVLASGGESASAWSHPALSPDGRSIAYVTFRTRYEILAQNVAADGRPAGAPAPLVATVAGRKIPVGFSPDGGRFAFVTLRPGLGLSLWVTDLTSGDARLVAEEPGLLLSRAWFPGGRRLGYVAPGKQGRSFWSVDVETGETREHRPVESHITWAFLLSPDGRSLLSHGAREGGLNVWVMDVDGGPARQLTHDAEGMGWPIWSPDGTRIAVEMMRGGTTRIGLMPAGGGPVREVVSTPGQSWPHSFSPDGRRIAFAGQRRGVWNVYSVPVEGGEERRLTAYDSPALYVRYPDWSPRGDRIAYEFAESTSTVWVRELPPPASP